MSLTIFLSNNDVRQKFRQEFPKPKFSVNKEMLAPPITKNYVLVGTAFDYLLRFYVEHINPNTITGPWVAEVVAQMIEDTDKVLHKKTKKIIPRAKENYSQFLKTGEITDDLINSTLLLAKLDFKARGCFIDTEMGVTDYEDVNDLRDLISIVDTKNFKAKNVCILNPTFGEGSGLVDGADADLIIDDILIDIKTTKKLELTQYHINQLMGYYILYKIGGIDGLSPKHKIKKLGIYFSRHGYLYVIDIQKIINKDTFPDFLEWFKYRASGKNIPTKSIDYKKMIEKTKKKWEKEKDRILELAFADERVKKIIKGRKYDIIGHGSETCFGVNNRMLHIRIGDMEYEIIIDLNEDKVVGINKLKIKLKRIKNWNYS